MPPETLDDLIPYLIGLIPCPLVAWSWVRWRRLVPLPVTPLRSRMTVVGLVLASASCFLLAIFTAVLHFLELRGSEAADGWYIRSVQVGFFVALVAVVLCLFAPGKLRLIMTGASVLLVFVWIFIGGLY